MTFLSTLERETIGSFEYLRELGRVAREEGPGTAFVLDLTVTFMRFDSLLPSDSAFEPPEGIYDEPAGPDVSHKYRLR